MRFIKGRFTSFSPEIEFLPSHLLLSMNQPILLSLYRSSNRYKIDFNEFKKYQKEA